MHMSTCRMTFVLVAALAVAGSARAANQTLYWTGASDGASTFTAGNWAKADGTAATAAPTTGDTLVFTNDTALALTASKAYPSMNWRFAGADVTGPRKTYNFGSGSSIEATGTGTYKFDNTVAVAANAGDIPVSVGSDATVYLSSYGTTTLNAGARIVKRGLGHLDVGYMYWNGTVALQAGRFYVNALKDPKAAALEFLGSDDKLVYIYGNVSSTLESYSEDAASLGKGALTVYTGSSPTLTLKGAEGTVTRFSSDFYNSAGGSYTLAWDPACAAMLNVVGRIFNRERAALSVKSGTLLFSEGAGAKKLGGGLSVASGATLAFADDASTDFSGTALVLETGSSVAFAGDGVAVTVSGVTVGGTALADGIYTSANAAWITGPGAVIAGAGEAEPETTAATWTGGGASAAMDEAANWGGTLPDLTNGSLVATFPADAVVSVPASGATRLKGIVARGALSLAGGRLRLGSAGLVTPASGVTVTVDCPVALTGDSTWTVGAADTVELTESAVLSSVWPTCVAATQTLTLNGSGRVNVRSSNPALCNVDFACDLHVYADNALGGPKVWTEAKDQKNCVNLYGNTFANNFRTEWHSSGTAHVLFYVRAGDSVIAGKVASTGGNETWWHFDNAAKGQASVTFRGGYGCTGNNRGTAFSPIHNGTVTVADTPMDTVKLYLGYVGYYWNVLNLNVASNRTTRGIHLTGQNSVLNTNVKDALYATDDGQSGVTLNMYCTWNLAADQGVNVFLGADETAKVSSTNGATLHLRDDRPNTVKPDETASFTAGETYYATLTGTRPQTNRVAFVGNVGFSKEGVLDHFMEGASTSTGDVTVKRGLLDFTTGSWRNAATVTVADGGRLGLTNPAGVFGRKVAFVVTGDDTDGSLVIPAGVTVKCASLTVNGVAQPNGFVTDGVVTGGGTLQVGPKGFVTIVK